MTGDRRSGCPIACFFKFILEPRLDLQKLVIPRNFLRTHGNDLSNVISLTIPSGKVWEFNLVRAKDKAFLQKGWPEFVHFYSLKHGHCLLFKYEGNSCFNVIIFDTSTSEIEYPLEEQSYRESSPPQNRKTIIDLTISTSPSKKAGPTKGMQTGSKDKLIIANGRCRGPSLNSEENKRVRAYYDHHCKHSSFATKMCPSFVRSKFAVGIPSEFAKRFLYNEPCPATFKLKINNGNTLLARSTSGSSSNNTHMKLHGAGWRKFASSNKIQVGDICIFELVKKQEFQVHILRVANARENHIPRDLAIDSL